MDLPTDLYYSDFYDDKGDFCSWDSNNNNIFGEFNWDDGNIDEVDLYADVYIGRIPCSNNFDLKIIIKKIINYENNAYGSDWFNRILLLGGDTFPNHGIIEGEYVTSRIAEEMNGFNPIFLWTSENHDVEPAITVEIREIQVHTGYRVWFAMMVNEHGMV